MAHSIKTRWEKEENKQLAMSQTEEAKEEIQKINNILLGTTVGVDDSIKLNAIKYRRLKNLYNEALYKRIWLFVKPVESDEKYKPVFDGCSTFFSPSCRREAIDLAKKKYESDLQAWEEELEEFQRMEEFERVEEIKNQIIKNQIGKECFEEIKNQIGEEHIEEDMNLIEEEHNERIIKLKEAYQNKKPEGIVDYCKLVLSSSEYPGYFPQKFEIDFNLENGVLIVEYTLPNMESLPTLKEVKYIASNDEFKEIHLSDSALKKMYDDLLYQITLRTIHELYEADVINAISSIVFNGWVTSVDKSTGQDTTKCILTVQANREEFLAINLANVDPKMCFKNLKGIGSGKLHSLTPVAPFLKINREDTRFASAHDVADGLDETVNLAAMDWEDFEHLVREIFSKEFSYNGGEVKVTRASRDGGVDAIAFDPDPIRGGKIVIQAKRYTNLVGVSAVRDLYGTVMNEGANKGILITTSNYGPDSYEFAKGKPLVLLNGANLLHLLEKHGHKAKIDIEEAKRMS